MPSYKRLLIASSKGGVGKSTTALGLAAAFARDGKRVLLIDLDFTSRSLDMLTGAENDSLFDFGDIAVGMKCDDVILRPIAELPTLAFVPALHIERLNGICDTLDLTERDMIRAGVGRLLDGCEYDLVICDTGGGITVPCAVADLFDLVLITSEQSKTSIRGAEYAAAQLDANGAKEEKLVICSFDVDAVRYDDRAGIIEVIDSSELACIGVVPFDGEVQRAQDSGSIPPADALSSVAYRNIAMRIRGYDTRLFDGMGKLGRKRKKAL